MVENDTHLTDRAQRDRALFDQISQRYARKDLIPTHRRARKLRLIQTLAAAGGVDGLRILEAGCGAGYAIDYLGERPAEYVGIDYSEELIGIARRANGGRGRRFEVTNIDDFNPASRFNVAFMIGLLHHLDDPVQTLNRMKRLVIPGGVVVANEPQSGNPMIRWMRAVRKKVDKQYSNEQLEYSKSELETIFSQAGLQDVRITAQGVVSTPFAEVVLPFQFLANPLSAVCCAGDKFLERNFGNYLHHLSWNLIVVGRSPND